MSPVYILWGVLIGIIVAAPMGPVNILCIRRTLTHGPMNGFVIGMGAALADTIFGAIAAFGLAGVTHLLNSYSLWVELIGGLVLLAVGFRIWNSHPHLTETNDDTRDRIKASVGAFLLTITNPMTILGFVAIFAGLGLGNMAKAPLNGVMLVAGVLLGSALWWFVLTEGVAHMKKKLTDDHLLWINRGCGVVVLGFGLWALGKNIPLML